MLNTREEILRIRASLAAGKQPWVAGFHKLAEKRDEYRAWTPRPARTYRAWPHWFQPGTSRDLVRDNEAVYANELLFAVTGEPSHAAKTTEIIAAWATTLERIEVRDGDRHEEVLATSYSWPAFTWAADLLEMFGASYDREAFEKMLRTHVEPVVRQTIHRNNWLSWGICCRLALALYFRDEPWFGETQRQFRDHAADYLALHHYRNRRSLPAPQLARLTKTRPEGWNRLGWGTLTHPATTR